MDLTGDDRATLFGAFLDLSSRMRGGDAGEDATAEDRQGVDLTALPSPAPASARDLLARWRRAGLRAFAADRDAAAAAGVTAREGEETAGGMPA